MEIRVLIVEDNNAVYQMYEGLLGNCEDIQIVGLAKSKEDALLLAKELKPDVMLVDINLTHREDQDGVDVAIDTALEDPSIKIVMCSAILNEETVRSTIGLGVATNYILKTDTERIPEAIRDAYKGVTNLDHSIVDVLLNDYREALKSTMVKLTKNHIKALELFYRGYSVEEVAKLLYLEVQSVRNLQQEIAKRCLGWKWRFKKLSTVELANRAKVLGLF